MLVSTVTALAVAGSAQAVGLESIDLPSLTAPDFLTNMSEAQQKKLEEAGEYTAACEACLLWRTMQSLSLPKQRCIVHATCCVMH